MPVEAEPDTYALMLGAQARRDEDKERALLGQFRLDFQDGPELAAQLGMHTFKLASANAEEVLALLRERTQLCAALTTLATSFARRSSNSRLIISFFALRRPRWTLLINQTLAERLILLYRCRTFILLFPRS